MHIERSHRYDPTTLTHRYRMVVHLEDKTFATEMFMSHKALRSSVEQQRFAMKELSHRMSQHIANMILSSMEPPSE